MSATTTRRNPAAVLRTLARPPWGSLIVLLVFCAIFSVMTTTFLAPGNLSLVVQQSVIVGTLAIGETLVILTAGIDLANGSIAVLGTIVAGRLVNDGYDALGCLVLAVVLCTLVGVVAGTLVSRLKLPPFIVTLGLLGIVTAATRLISQGGAFPVTDDLLAWTGNVFTLGGAPITYGMVIMIGLYGLIWYILTQTAWGRQIYAIGNSPAAARLVGISGHPPHPVGLCLRGLSLWRRRLARFRADSQCRSECAAIGESRQHHCGGHRRHQPVRWAAAVSGARWSARSSWACCAMGDARGHRSAVAGSGDRRAGDRGRGARPALALEAAVSAAAPLVLETRRIVKRYGHVTALGGVDFELRDGEVMAVIGDNGAGKSTLVKVLSGAITPDEGQVLLDGAPIRFSSPLEARMRGSRRSIRNSPWRRRSISRAIFSSDARCGAPVRLGHGCACSTSRACGGTRSAIWTS